MSFTPRVIHPAISRAQYSVRTRACAHACTYVVFSRQLLPLTSFAHGLNKGKKNFLHIFKQTGVNEFLGSLTARLDPFSLLKGPQAQPAHLCLINYRRS